MTTSKAYKDVILIVGRYSDPIKAQFTLYQYCKNCNITTDEFEFSNLPKFILFLATERDNLNGINDDQYNRLVKDLVHLSNQEDQKTRNGNGKEDDKPDNEDRGNKQSPEEENDTDHEEKETKEVRVHDIVVSECVP